MRFLTFPAPLATGTLRDKMSWLQAGNAMTMLFENFQHLVVWQRPELLSGVQGMLTRFTSHTAIMNVNMTRLFRDCLLWSTCMTSVVSVTYLVLISTHS